MIGHEWRWGIVTEGWKGYGLLDWDARIASRQVVFVDG